MRRTYISPEYKKTETYGTFNMVEESNFFGSKMLEVEDSINIESQSIIYYQKTNGEQIDLSVESSLDSIVYSSSTDKQKNHTLVLDESQSTYQKDNNTTWILNIELQTILSDFLFATLKRYRTFEGMKTEMTKNYDIDSSIKEYINQNVLNRYKFKSLDLYIQFKDLRNQNVLRYKNTWNQLAYKPENKFSKYQKDLTFDGSKLKVIFNQDKSSKDYTFEYYFNILFEKV
jgi:hypothetical protein